MVLPFRYYSYSATFINPGYWVPLHGFTGLTICCATPPPLTYTFHSNEDFYLFGPAWFLPMVFSTNMQTQEVVKEDESMPKEAVSGADGAGMIKSKTQQSGCYMRRFEKKETKSYWKPKSVVNSNEEEESVPCAPIPNKPKLEEKKGAKLLKLIDRDSSLTTVMIKNIPNRYTVGMLVGLLDEHCKEENQKIHGDDGEHRSEFDFFYLPMDFKSNCNKGFAFVNFTHPDAVWRLNLSWSGTKWKLFKSNKICELTYADKQGKKELLKHFESSEFACDPEEYLPTYFEPPRDGSGKPVKQTTIGRRVDKL